MKNNLVIITTCNYPYGSASANLLRLLGRGLVQKGWSVETFVQQGFKTDKRENLPPICGVEQGVPHRFCGFNRRPQNLIFKFADSIKGLTTALWYLILKKTRKEIDFILLYNKSGGESILYFLLCRCLRIKTIAYVTEWYEKSMFIKKWYHYPKWWDFLFLMKYVNSKMDRLLVVSSYLYHFYIDTIRMSHNKVSIFPNLVDIESFRSTGGIVDIAPDDVFRIGYCGTPTYKDGIKDLILAFAKVHAVDCRTQLLIIGGQIGNKELIPSLIRLTESLGIKNCVRFTGMVSYDRIPVLLHSCDALALARPDGVFAKAGFPTKLGEYLACRKPVVATRVGDIPHYLSHKHTAMLAEPSDPQDFAAQILWIINHKEDSFKIASNGYQWVVDALDYQKVAASFIDFVSPVFGE